MQFYFSRDCQRHWSWTPRFWEFIPDWTFYFLRSLSWSIDPDSFQHITWLYGRTSFLRMGWYSTMWQSIRDSSPLVDLSMMFTSSVLSISKSFGTRSHFLSRFASSHKSHHPNRSRIHVNCLARFIRWLWFVWGYSLPRWEYDHQKIVSYYFIWRNIIINYIGS